MQTDPYDVVIVGGGAAGLSAALVLGRARRGVAVVDSGTPRNAPASHMQGYLSRDGMPPADLVAIGRAEVARYGVEVVDDVVLGIRTGFTLQLETGRSLTARQVLVTTGLLDVTPDIPGVLERWGRDLLHCPYCHGWEVRDEPLGVLGTNPGSIPHAQLIRQWSDDVVYFAHTQEPSDREAIELSARGIRVVHGEVARLVIEDDRLAGVELADGQVVPRHAVFVRPIMTPHPDSLLRDLECDVDGAGFPVTDPAGRTSVGGLWAAGNATDPRAQVITAAGQGSAAAIAINNDLIEDDIAVALGGRHS
jgi:thioredoxin reductase